MRDFRLPNTAKGAACAMESGMKYYFIVNPHSRTDQGRRIWEQQLLPVLRSGKTDWEVLQTARAGHCTELVRALTAGPHGPITIVILGGDGTLNEAVNGIDRFENLTLAYLPIGSGNDFARGMRLRGTPAEQLRGILARRHELLLDYGEVQADGAAPQRFLVSSGIGFDAYVTDEALTSPVKNVMNALHLGSLTYAVIAVKQLIRIPLQPAVLTTDDGMEYRFDRFYFASSHNLPYEGGGFRFAPDARPDDGLLHVCAVTALPKPLVLLALPTAFFGLHVKVPGIRILPCRNLRVSLANPYPVHTDGETYHPRTRIEVRCIPGRLHFVY